MAAHGLFVDVVLPACIVTGLGSFLLYALLSRFLYDHVLEHYGDMLDKPQGSLYADPEELGAYMASVWQLTRSGRFRRIQSRAMRWLFIVNAVTGFLLIASSALICTAFLPHPWH